MPISENDDEFDEIPRNRLLTAPKIIMYKLVFKYFGEMGEKTLKKILRRGYSQISQNLTKLVNQGFIRVEKNGRENKIRATKLGIIYIQEYLNSSFKEIISYFNFINNLGEIDENIHKLIELVNSVLKNQEYYQNLSNQHKIEKKKEKMDYYQRVYDRVAKGNANNSLLEKVFDFLNNNPSDYNKFQPNFDDKNHQTVKTYYDLWLKITLEKDRSNLLIF